MLGDNVLGVRGEANAVQHFHSCQYGGAREKNTMLAFSSDVFHAVSAKCKRQNSKHKHAAWGLDKNRKKFATSEETAYPMGLAKMLANCIVLALIYLGIKAPEETMHQLKSIWLKSLQQMKAATGLQPKASRIPPLVPTFKARIKLQAMSELLPDFQLYQMCKQNINLDAPNDPVLPKGAKLLSIQPAKTLSDEGGEDQSLPPILLGKDLLDEDAHQEQMIQTWGGPWSPLEFVNQAAKAGHACLPVSLKVLSQNFRMVPLLERCRHRIQRTKFWMDRMAALKSDEQTLKSKMRKDARQILADKNMLIWKEMLAAINYEDMGVVDEFMHGSSLVGAAPSTGLWPARFTPATMSVEELHDAARCERAQGVKAIDMDDYMLKAVWTQILAGVEAGFLIGPIELDEVPAHIRLSKRFGVKHGAKTRYVDDFSTSGMRSSE